MRFPCLLASAALIAPIAAQDAAEEWKNPKAPRSVPPPAFKVPDGYEVTTWAMSPDRFHEKVCQKKIKISILVVLLGWGLMSNNGILLPYAL